MITLLRSTAGQLLAISKRCFLFVTMAVVLLLATGSPTLAALSAQDQPLSEQQSAQAENLKLTPGGGQYSGLEQVESSSGKALSDAEIKQKIRSDIASNIVVNSANGSVNLSGTVADRETARRIVEQVKEIPGVKEITFELGLQTPAGQSNT